jgi:hypothetical protein
VVVGAALGLRLAAVASAAACTGAGVTGAAKELFEEVAVVLARATTACTVGELEAGVPVGRGRKSRWPGGWLPSAS